MSQITVDITMSLDGFVTAPNDREGQGLGEDGEVLHNWVFGGPWTYEHVPEPAGEGVDGDLLDEAVRSAGAAVVGRRMYEISDAWGGSSPFDVPCVVVTHRVEDQPAPESGFHFVDGVEAAVDRAQEIAGDKGVNIGGGASVIQQALNAGLVDCLRIHLAPVILGAGRPLFGELGTRIRLEEACVVESPHATHLDYRIVR